jgi:hypothetical protein
MVAEVGTEEDLAVVEGSLPAEDLPAEEVTVVVMAVAADMEEVDTEAALGWVVELGTWPRRRIHLTHLPTSQPLVVNVALPSMFAM